MGNSSLLGGRKTTKVMKINGETMKLRTPIKAEEIVKDYPGHVLLESEAVKHYGTRAKPLEADQDLVPRRLYFLVELPKVPAESNPRRVRSGINMSAKDRLESLMLARRSASDLSIIKPASSISNSSGGGSPMRVKMRLPRAEVERLMRESKDGEEATSRIVDLYIQKSSTSSSSNNSNNGGGGNGGVGNGGERMSGGAVGMEVMVEGQVHWNKSSNKQLAGSSGHGQKKVSFMPINESEVQQIAVASY